MTVPAYFNDVSTSSN
ncbi:hypothetical protein ABVN80_19165 [Acinetobacter baumannii]